MRGRTIDTPRDVETVPDIVVTDIAMPGLDGFGLAAALRADRLTKHVPLIGMTAHWTAEIQSEAQRAGFSAMLLKPRQIGFGMRFDR